jgi:hypothetical protein
MIIEFLTQLWGGGNAIIIPTDGALIDDVFWTLLAAHDPDLILTYHRTGEDVRRNQPGQFEEAVNKEAEELVRERADAEWTRREVSRSLARAHCDNFTVADGLLNAILTRLAPFAFQRKISQPSVTAGGAPFYPLVSILDVLDKVEHPNETVEIQNDSTMPDIWLAASLGWSTGSHLGALNEKGYLRHP